MCMPFNYYYSLLNDVFVMKTLLNVRYVIVLYLMSICIGIAWPGERDGLFSTLE